MATANASIRTAVDPEDNSSNSSSSSNGSIHSYRTHTKAPTLAECHHRCDRYCHSSPAPTTTSKSHRRHFSIQTSSASAITSPLSSQSSLSSPSDRGHSSKCCYHGCHAHHYHNRHNHNHSYVHNCTQSATTPMTSPSPSFFKRIFKAFVGSNNNNTLQHHQTYNPRLNKVHPLERPICCTASAPSSPMHPIGDKSQLESETQTDESESCEEYERNANSTSTSNRRRPMMTATFDSSRPQEQQSNHSKYSSLRQQKKRSNNTVSASSTVSICSRDSHSTKGIRRGYASDHNSSSRNSSSVSTERTGSRRSSVTSSIGGESIHYDLGRNSKHPGFTTNHQQYRQHFTGHGYMSSPTVNHQHDIMKRFFKSMAVVGVSASGSYSRRGSAFSTKSQETAVNLTDINLHLSEKPNEGNDEEEYEGDGGKMDLDAVLGDENNNEHEYDHDYSDKEQDQESQNNYYATHDAMLTTEMELELHRHREEKSMKRQTVRRLQHLHQLRCQGLLSDGDNSLLLKNNSDSMVDHVSSPLIEQQQEHLHRLSPIQLPEILHLIFQFVVDFTPQEEYSQREIYNCMLVSKQWYLVAQKTLWHEIRFKTPTKLGCFIDLLKRTEGKGGVSPEKTNYSVQQQQIQLTEIDDKDRIRQQQGTHRRQRHESIQYRQKHQLTESIMAPEAMQRRLHERAMAVKKIVLHKLKLIEDQDIMPLTSWFHNLQILEFYICEKLTDVTVAAIAENCPRLQQLLMPGCAKVTDQGISQIALHCPRMKHLDLRACSNVSDESLVLVARHCSELWHLNVGRVSAASKVTGKSIVEIAKNTNLNTLGLAGCAMTDDAVIDIARYSRSGLHRISLNSCPMLTSASVRALMQLCPNLAVLEIKQCLLVTDMATLYRFSTRRVLVELCPELQKRFLEYKVGVVTMNTSAQFNNIHPSVSSTQQAQGPNGQDSMSSAQTTATMTTVADNNGSNINSNNNNNSSIMIANDNVSMIQPTTTTVASHP